jgi:hypothetical protein
MEEMKNFSLKLKNISENKTEIEKNKFSYENIIKNLNDNLDK